MLHGGIFRKLLLFALPLIASGILQQSFNSVDVAVVGQFASSQALAAVGSNGLVISLIINLFIGISIGANVVIAHYIGRQDEKGIKNAISTTAIIAVTSGIFLLITGLLIAKPILEALDTPEDVIDLAVLYLRIYSLGMPFMMIYNFGAAILRSLGDTKRPFYSLVVAGAINVGLNLLLVIEFEMSVAGVAVATVISNIVNAGIIGTSVNEERGGLRFVYRLQRTVENGKTYVLLRGVKTEIVDYGMLIALDANVGNRRLDAKLAAENSRIKMISVKDANRYYDYCDDYIDMSTCITNIDKVEGGLTMKLVARAYVITADDKTLYADMASSTYERVSGMKSVSFAALTAANQVLATGRAGQVGSEFQMDWVNSGFEISGDLADNLRVKMTSSRVDSLLNVQVDDDAVQIIHVPQGTSTVTLASGLAGGEHTVRVIGGTSLRFGTLSPTELQYNGTLNEVKRDGTQLRLEVLGDSISCGWGLDMPKGQTYTTTEQVAGSNSYYSYAGVAARELGADLSVVAQCSQTISEINSYWKKLNKRSGAAAWDFASHQQDVVVINLGTNDEWRSGYQDAAKALTDAKAILADVRAAYPDAYIIWAYNMMAAKDDFAASYLAAVQSMNDSGDSKVFALKFDSDKTYYEGHPARASHEKNGKELAAFIKANCTELFGHTTHTETIGALTAANKVIFNGRTTASGTARTMDYGSTGITISGYLYGKLSMNINFGIIPPLDHFVKGKRNKNAEISQRALAILEEKKADILA